MPRVLQPGRETVPDGPEDLAGIKAHGVGRFGERLLNLADSQPVGGNELAEVQGGPEQSVIPSSLLRARDDVAFLEPRGLGVGIR
jgi:hypothetical protein